MNVETKQSPDNLKVFAALSEAVAYLWQLDEYGSHCGGLHAAVDELEERSRQLKIDADTGQQIMGSAFAAVRDDLGGWKP